MGDVEAYVQASGEALIAGEPAYFPAQDEIAMPTLAAFPSQASYNATLLHELTHRASHAHRLNGDLTARFGNTAYATEKLIAELGAAFPCAPLGIAGEVCHAGYIEHGLKLMHGDKKAIFTAAAKAAEFLTALNSRRSHATCPQPTLSEPVPA